MSEKYHEAHLPDRAIMLAMRASIAMQPEPMIGPQGRAEFDTLMEKTAAPTGVDYEAASLCGVQGWWCRPDSNAGKCAVLYFHGGAYVQGSAAAYRHFVGQIAQRSGVPIFIANYRLAPEHPFPAALDDAMAAYKGLADAGLSEVIIAGDSAGGGLGLALLQTILRTDQSQSAPLGACLFSPWTDLALTGESLITRAAEDPLLSRDILNAAAELYLAGGSRRDPGASPLYGTFENMPPVLIHVGEDEVLLDDSRRVADSLRAAGADVQMNIWQGMTHVFLSNLLLSAAREALDLTAHFIRQRFRLHVETTESKNDHVGKDTR